VVPATDSSTCGGAQPRKTYDAAYRTFVEDVAEEITQILADARSHEAERQRAESYVALAKFRQEALSHEQALRQEADGAKAQIVSILESMGDGFVSLDDDLRITGINTATERIFHLRREELLDRPYLDAIPQARGTHGETALKRALTEGTPVTFEAFYRPADIWVGVSIYSLPQGGLSMFIRDITERKHLEKAIQKSEERFRVALKGSPSLFFNMITSSVTSGCTTHAWIPTSDVAIVGKPMPNIFHRTRQLI
jgi:PAS domain S-box-containing protein